MIITVDSLFHSAILGTYQANNTHLIGLTDMTKQDKQNWIWFLTTGTIAIIAITKLVIEFNKYGVL